MVDARQEVATALRKALKREPTVAEVDATLAKAATMLKHEYPSTAVLGCTPTKRAHGPDQDATDLLDKVFEVAGRFGAMSASLGIPEGAIEKAVTLVMKASKEIADEYEGDFMEWAIDNGDAIIDAIIPFVEWGCDKLDEEKRENDLLRARVEYLAAAVEKLCTKAGVGV